MEIKTLADLIPDQKNARKHNPRNIGMIAKAIGEVGVGRSIVIDEDGNILAGNGTVEALAECGITDVRVIKANGNELIAVQRSGLSEEQKKKLALYDNRTAELAEWDADVLREINLEMPELLENMFMPLELDELLDISTATGPVEGEDDAPEVPEDPITNTGDLYVLGEHRLICGDCTDKETVGTLMDGQKADMVFTDPPYGIDAVKNSGVLKKRYRDMENDYSINVAVKAFHLNDLRIPMVWWGANYYAANIPNQSCWLVWDKNNGGSDQMDCELAWTNFPGVTRIFKKASEKVNRVHPTQKPVELIEWCLNKMKASIIYDPFGGSGSTLIACEKLNRKCYMMEIDPAYCDVIVKRWEQFTGKKAELSKEEATV